MHVSNDKLFIPIARLHDTAPLSTIASKMRQELNAKLKNVADKATKGLNLEKRAWNDLHNIESEVESMSMEIDQCVEKAVSMMILLVSYGLLCFLLNLKERNL
mgnify:CR=1 FL=1